MPADRREPLVFEDSPIFTNRDEAEWEIFRRRWRAATGEDINLPFKSPENRRGDCLMLKIVGYPDRYSVAPGEKIAFTSRSRKAKPIEARLVRVLNGDSNPNGPGLEIPASAKRRRWALYRRSVKRADAGSFMLVEGLPPLAAYAAFSFRAVLWPTLPRAGSQVIAAHWDADRGRGFQAHRQKKVGHSPGDRRRHGHRSRKVSCEPCWMRKWYAVALAIDLVRRRLRSVTASAQARCRHLRCRLS